MVQHRLVSGQMSEEELAAKRARNAESMRKSRENKKVKQAEKKQ